MHKTSFKITHARKYLISIEYNVRRLDIVRFMQLDVVNNLANLDISDLLSV